MMVGARPFRRRQTFDYRLCFRRSEGKARRTGEKNWKLGNQYEGPLSDADRAESCNYWRNWFRGFGDKTVISRKRGAIFRGGRTAKPKTRIAIAPTSMAQLKKLTQYVDGLSAGRAWEGRRHGGPEKENRKRGEVEGGPLSRGCRFARQRDLVGWDQGGRNRPRAGAMGRFYRGNYRPRARMRTRSSLQDSKEGPVAVHPRAKACNWTEGPL